MTDAQPRPLTPKERALLDLLLSQKSFPGAQELAAQIEHARVVGGLATLLDLEVLPTAVIANCDDGPIPVRAFVESPDGEVQGEVLVWVKGGYLSGIEFAWYTDEAPSELPSPDCLRVE
jgi:hypothetical protein